LQGLARKRKTYDRLGAFVQSILDTLEGSYDTLVAGDFAVFDGNIEVHSDE
jgi:hypothetical protein